MSVEISQLFLFLLLNAIVLLNALWLTCLLGGWRTWAERLLDCFLYFMSLVVAGFYVLHFLHWVSVDGLFLLHGSTTALLALAAKRQKWRIRDFFTLEPLRDLGWIGQAVCWASIGWMAVYVYVCRYLVPVGTDALNYHLPLPVHWLKDRELTMVFGMFLDPQLSYTPIAGELFFAWLIAPFGNDVAVRFGQMPFVVGAILALYTLWRRWNLPAFLAVAAAGLLLWYRPFLRQIVLPNNDIMLATWFLVFFCQWQRLDSDWRGWARCGLALGLLGATKVLGLLFAVPCFVLLAQRAVAQRREWNWLNIVAPLLAVVAVGGFTYLRNWFLTGNPFYPALVRLGGLTIFDGMMDSDAMATAHRSWQTIRSFLFTRGTFGMAKITTWIWAGTALLAPVGWMARRAMGGRANAEALWIWFALGASYLIVVWKTPFLDERYLLPVYGAGLIFVGWWLEWFCARRLWWVALAAVVAVAVCFGKESVLAGMGRPALACIASVAALGWLTLFLASRRSRRLHRIGFLGLLVLWIFAILYFWPAYLRTYQEIKFHRFPHIYPGQGPAWFWLNEQTKERPAIIAYVGSPLTYPLFGQDLQNSVVYVSIEKDAQRAWHKLGWPPELVSTSHAMIHQNVARVARGEPDLDAWLRRILELRCNYLVVVPDVDKNPIEREWALSQPALFRKAFENPEAGVVVFEVAPPLEDAVGQAN